MKSFLFLLTGFVFFSQAAGAQAARVDPELLASANFAKALASPDPSVTTENASIPVSAEAIAANPPAKAQDSQGVGPTGGVVADPAAKLFGDWELFAGYTFTRFYEVPGSTLNLNGYNFGLGFYPRGSWLGGEGEFTAAFGTLHGESSRLITGMGGVKARWVMNNGYSGMTVWVHGLAGDAHFSPQTQYGNEGSVGYEVGGGADLSKGSGRWALRVEGDMVGTRFFGLKQYSPKVGAGIVFKF